MAWKQIVDDKRLHDAMTTSQIADAEDKARTNRDSAQKAVRAAWSHILYAVKSDIAGKPFELEHSLISSRDRAAIFALIELTEGGYPKRRKLPARCTIELEMKSRIFTGRKVSIFENARRISLPRVHSDFVEKQIARSAAEDILCRNSPGTMVESQLFGMHDILPRSCRRLDKDQNAGKV
jgi:hypothetical protein